MGLFKKKDAGAGDDDANRNALFGSRKGKGTPPAAYVPSTATLFKNPLRSVQLS